MQTNRQRKADKSTGEPAASRRSFSFDELEKILLYFSTSILEKNTEEETLWDLAQNCIAQLRFVDCVIYLLDEEKQALVQKAAHGPKNPKAEDILQPIDIPLGQGITGSVALSGVAEIVGDTSADPRYIVDDAPRLSEIAVPILLDGKVLGVIDCEHPERHFFTGQHLRILSAIASICAVKLSRIRAERLAQHEQQRLMEVQKQMEELKAKALKVQINPHFLFNALNAVQYFITDDDKKSALSYLSLLGKLIRYRLAHFHEETARLSSEIEALGWYLKLQQLRYGDKFSYSVETQHLQATDQIKIPALILPFILESAVEQAMLDQPAGNMQLRMEATGQEIKLRLLHNLRNPLDRNGNRMANYRDDMEPWQAQVAQLNRLQPWQIRERSTFLKNSDGHITGVEILLDIPILT